MGEVSFHQLGYDKNRPWIERQNLLAEWSNVKNETSNEITKQLEKTYYQCGMCRATYVVEQLSYIVVASMFFLHYKKCKNAAYVRLSEDEILRMGRIKFFSFLKKCRLEEINVPYKYDKVDEQFEETQRKQSRFNDIPYDIVKVDKIWEF